MVEKDKDKIKYRMMGVLFISIEVFLLFLLFSFFSSPVWGGVGENVTVLTELTVGNVAPEVLNVSINDDGATLTLTANGTAHVECVALLRDWNNESDIQNVSAEFFDNTASGYGGGAASDDKNDHYTNTTCFLNKDFGSWRGVADTNYLAFVNCSFTVQYYSNPGTWNCTVWVNDSLALNDTGSDVITVSELLAIGLPSTINYGTVNATQVSGENVTNVTNLGNVDLNISLSGYAINEGDNLAMNCSLGSIGNISVNYERYNLTSSIPGNLSLADFEANYSNLTSTSVVREFNLAQRKSDSENEATNSTYWRIYVPLGVAGTCSGNIIFGGVQSEGT